MKKIRSKMKVLYRVLTRLYFNFLDVQGQLTAVRGQIWPNFKLICTLMVVLITCKNEEDPIKNEGTRVLTAFSPL